MIAQQRTHEDATRLHCSMHETPSNPNRRWRCVGAYRNSAHQRGPWSNLSAIKMNLIKFISLSSHHHSCAVVVVVVGKRHATVRCRRRRSSAFSPRIRLDPHHLWWMLIRREVHRDRCVACCSTSSGKGMFRSCFSKQLVEKWDWRRNYPLR